MNSYWPGTAVTLTAPFTTPAGVAVDPTTVTFKTKSPAGTITSYVYLTDAALVKVSVGIYALTITPTVSGAWYVWVIGTGAAAVTAQVGFEVRKAEF